MMASPAALLRLPLIHMHWQAWEPEAPTWSRWAQAARRLDQDLAEPDPAKGLFFSEELHAIEAIIDGQGVGVCSDLLVARELASGRLAKAFDLSLPGFGFYVAYLEGHPRRALIESFSHWAQCAACETES